MRKCSNCGQPTANGRRTCSAKCLSARRAVGIRRHGGVTPPVPLILTSKYQHAGKLRKIAMELGER